MKNFLTKLAWILYIVFFLTTGCVKFPGEQEPAPFIQITPKVLQFDNIGGSNSFTVKSNYNWSITGASAYCTVAPLTGEKDNLVTVNITVNENDTDNDRDFPLTVTANKESAVVTIKQESKNYAATSSQVTVSNFSILPENNSEIYSKITFIPEDGDQSKFKGDQEILYYKATVSSLAASWITNAKRVVVSGIDQIRDITKQNYENEVIFRFYAKDNTFIEYKLNLSNPSDRYSGLPLLVLTTDDGVNITSKDIWSNGKFKLDTQNNPGVEELTGITKIRGRGNSTWGQPKKPYALKLDDKGEGIFMGMNAHKRWVLLANHYDKTGLRNRVAFELGKKVKLPWTSDSKFVEVMLNGKYLGNYQLTEHIKIDENRVNIQEIDNKETSTEKITGGWLLEIDRFFSTGETRYFRPEISELPVIVKEPEDANDTQMDYIKNYFKTLEKLLYPTLPQGTPYNQSNAHLAGVPDSSQYGQYIDINSFINYWIVQELTENEDSRLPGSVYMYKNVGSKLFIGPLWDFDLTTFRGYRRWIYYNYVPSDNDYSVSSYRSVYYSQLFKDPKFKARAKERWNEVYNILITQIPTFIDNEYSYIAKSMEINWIDIGENEAQGVWPVVGDDITTGGRNHDMNLRCVDAVARLKTNYIKKVEWMNSQINSW